MRQVNLIVTDKRGRKHCHVQANKAEAIRKANTEFKGLKCRVVGGTGQWETGKTRKVRSYSDLMQMRGGY